MRHPFLRLHATLRRSRGPLAAIGAWLGLATLAFRAGGGLPWSDAIEAALYLRVEAGPFAQGYAFWGQSLLFGVLVALVLRETLENHMERCRLMAQLVSGHTIIVGYTHLGARLVAHCIEKRLPFVLIERNRELVDDLLRRGEPVLVDDAKTPDALPGANIKGAKRVIIASNNLETALLVTKRARESSPECQVIVRCPDDELIEVLQHLGAQHVFSASQTAFQQISRHLS